MTQRVSKKQPLVSLIVFTLSGTLLASCSVYKNNFTCGEAKGARCVSMDQVDKMINNGKIEYFNEQQVNHKASCNGKSSHHCSKSEQQSVEQKLEETKEGPLTELKLYFNELEAAND